jgi:2',3'-cyclic-nucleotide 2'-phosphodiesterase/3'-nucleotidase
LIHRNYGQVAVVFGLAVTLAGPALAAAPQTVELTLLGTTDVHGHIYPTTYFNGDAVEDVGLAKLYTLIKEARTKNPNTVLVDSGDMLQGSPLAYYQAKVAKVPGPNPMIQAMNVMGYTVAGVGNHEFNFGLPHLFRSYSEAKFPLISGNIYGLKPEYSYQKKLGSKEAPAPVFKPYHIEEVAGVKVGIVSFAPPGITIWDKANVEGKIDVGDILVAAKRWIPELKKQGADIIIANPHSGLGGNFGPAYSGYSASSGLPPENVGLELARLFPEIDVIFAGHSHQNVPAELTPEGVACCQAGKWGEHLAIAHLKLAKQNGKWKVVSKKTETRSTKGVAPAPEVLAATKAAHEATVAYVRSAIAKTSTAWDAKESQLKDTALVDLINQVQLEATGAQLSSAASFNTEAVLEKGDISIADIASVYPYENNLVAIQITGKQLKEYLEHTARFFNPAKPGLPVINPEVRGYNYDMVVGVDYQIDRSKPIGQRIVKLTYQGKSVRDDQTFTMAMNSYRQRGGGGYEMFQDAPVVYSKEESIRELLIEFLRKRQTIEPKDVFRKNWELLPASTR